MLAFLEEIYLLSNRLLCLCRTFAQLVISGCVEDLELAVVYTA